MRIEHRDTARADETTIAIQGLQETVTLLHITDSHLTEVDERDPETIAAGHELGEHFKARSPQGVRPRVHFRDALARARQTNVDYVILTGDIIHFPSAANLEAVDDELAVLDQPFLYTPGNHDWQFPHLPSNDETRATYYPRFHSLTNGNPAYQARDIGGVRLVALDNSNYQITDDQLAFLREQLASPLPCLLFIHIPIALPSLAPDVVAAWGAPIMMAATGWAPGLQAEWNVRDSDQSTLLCHQLLTEEAPANLVGIFCGHVHFVHKDEIRDSRFQYVTGPGFEGASRLIRLLPG